MRGRYTAHHRRQLCPTGHRHEAMKDIGHLATHPGVTDIISQQISQALRNSGNNNHMAVWGSPATSESLENNLTGQGSSLEIEARLGLLKNFTGEGVCDHRLMMPTILQSQSIPQWKFTPSLCEEAFRSIKSFVKDEVYNLEKSTPSVMRNVKNSSFLRPKQTSHERVQVLPRRESIEMIYEDNSRVSHSAITCAPTSVMRKEKVLKYPSFAKIYGNQSMPKGHASFPQPDPLICMIPNTRVAICFSVLKEEYIPFDNMQEIFRKRHVRLRAVRHKCCSSVLCGNLWRIDAKKVATWNANECSEKKDVEWFRDNSPLNVKAPRAHSNVKTSREIELELSASEAKRLYLQDARRGRRSCRYTDLVESFVHHAQKLAIVPREYAFLTDGEFRM